jgi:uncharacterized heparinase superfamily protein
MALDLKLFTGNVQPGPAPEPARSHRERLAWYWARTASMDAREIAHRVVEGATKQLSRRLVQGWDAITPSGSLVPLTTVADGLRRCGPSLARTMGREADAVRQGRFELLGATWPVPATLPPPPAYWHVDPDDGEVFPQRDAYCFDVSFRHGVNTREVKRVWELSRLQFLAPLAAYGALTGSRDKFELVMAVIRSWMDGNHPFRGVNWSSGIELALRVISVALAFSFIGIERLDEESRKSLLRFFSAHAYWLNRFPSLHSSANNHRIAELAGLIVSLSVAPEAAKAKDQRESYWRELLVEIDRQIHPDGVGAEQAPAYTAFAVELFLVAAMAYGKQRDLPQATKDRLAAWAEHTLWLMDTDGKVPAIGDADDCRAIATAQAREPRYVASIVAAIASILARPDLAPPKADANLRNVLLLGSTEAAPKERSGLRTFEAGGYSVFRGKGKAPAVLTFDHGPVGYLSIAAHGHADTLAVWLTVGGQPIFVDAGTYRYHSRKALRDGLRDSAVHNTLTLRGHGSSRPSGLFNWATKTEARCIASENGPPARVTAEHDGYFAEFGLKHRRSVAFDGASKITITDELIGDATDRDVAISFLLDPSCKARLEADGSLLIAAGGRPVARLQCAGALKPAIVRGDEASALGWVSPSFGVRVPTDQIVFRGNLDTPSVTTVTLLV